MASHAIRVDGLGKRYRVGLAKKAPENVREKVMGVLNTPFDYLRTTLREPSPEELVWAVRDVSFEIPRGQVVGLIGRNGAGKSTLLKLLTRITDPTAGRAEIYGRVGSLLEVGTGFHPELTGRENIYLNGSILGMTRREIARRFDEIVGFSEVDRFLDTPVKRYSSGMYVRLAFSVAAHLEPEVLIVDEVLAVGDASFQRKCMDKMEEVTGHGRTILFVSHNMSAINRLCPTAILMESGRMVAYGPVSEVTGRYLRQGSTATAEWQATQNELVEGGEYQITAARVMDAQDGRADTLRIDAPIHVEVDYTCRKGIKDLHVQVQVLSDLGEMLFATCDNLVKNRQSMTHEPGDYRSTCTIPGNLLAEGAHVLSVVLIDMNERRKYDVRRRILSFWVVDPSDGNTVRGRCPGDWPGLMRPMLDWRVGRRIENESTKRSLTPLKSQRATGD
jgi:lipopolysaccharide transport system ATP-binding protein